MEEIVANVPCGTVKEKERGRKGDVGGLNHSLPTDVRTPITY